MKWIESRRENFLCTIHGRGHVDFYEIAAKRDGTITGIKLKIIQDLGAYHQLLTPAIPTLSVLMMPGLYQTPNIRADIIGAFTNCVPTDAYRGAGRPEATHGIERMVDMFAAELKMDPAEIRLKNFVQQRGVSVPDGDRPDLRFGRLFRAAQEGHRRWPGYDKLRKEQVGSAQAGQADGHRHVDLWRDLRVRSFAGDARGRLGERHGEDRAVGQGHGADRASPPHGQGEETTFAQIAADELGVDIDDMLVLHGDTSIVQYGIGTFGSRGDGGRRARRCTSPCRI